MTCNLDVKEYKVIDEPDVQVARTGKACGHVVSGQTFARLMHSCMSKGRPGTGQHVVTQVREYNIAITTTSVSLLSMQGGRSSSLTNGLGQVDSMGLQANATGPYLLPPPYWEPGTPVKSSNAELDKEKDGVSLSLDADDRRRDADVASKS